MGLDIFKKTKKNHTENSEETPKFSSKEDLEEYVDLQVKRRLDKIIERAKEESSKMEEDWREPKFIDVEDITYYVDGEEQEEIEPRPLKKKKKLRPYMSYPEFVLSEVEKERKR